MGHGCHAGCAVFGGLAERGVQKRKQCESVPASSCNDVEPGPSTRDLAMVFVNLHT